MSDDRLKYKIARGVSEALGDLLNDWSQDLKQYSSDPIQASRLFCEILNEYSLDLMERTFSGVLFDALHTETDLDDPDF